MLHTKLNLSVLLSCQLGGTVGDIEGMPYIEAFRQFQFRVGRDNFCVVHVSLIPEVISMLILGFHCHAIEKKNRSHSMNEVKKLTWYRG